MTSKQGGLSSLNRRQLLATIGMGAVAGCSSEQSIESPTQTELIDANQTDCIERSQYNQLRDDYEELRKRFSNLQNRVQNARLPPYIFADRRKITVTYETLEGDYHSWWWESSTLTAQNTAGTIAREMSYSQLEYLGWDDFGFEGRSKYTQLGNHGRYYQLNPFTVPSNFTPLSKEIYNRHETDQQRIRAAWNFATQLSNYVSEIQETPRMPLETLLMGGGDCEDSAILLGSILHAMPANFEPTFWYIDIDNPTDPEQINHVMLSAETSDGSMLIETTGDTMLPYDQVSGYSVPVDPTDSRS